MGKYPVEKNRAILHILNSAEIKDIKGNFLRTKEWLNPNQIQSELKKIGMGTVSRDEITSFLIACCERDEHYVKRRKPQRKDPHSETKAQNEFKLTETGRAFLETLYYPNFDFINKKYGK